MDYAQRLTSLLTQAGSQRAEQARALSARVDANGDAQISGEEFQHLFATLLADPSRMPQVTGAVGLVHRTLFADTLYPSFSRHHAVSAYLAQEAVAAFDVDQNDHVSLSELEGHVQAPPPDPVTPTTPNDVDPTLLAATLLAQYDSDLSGGISSDEFVTQAQVADPANTFAAWDVNSDGDLTLEELQSGIAQVQQAQNIIKQYDLTGKGYFDEADLIAALDPATVDDVAERAKQIMAFWDVNGDGQVGVAEVVSGIEAGGYVGGEQLKTSTTPA